MRRIFVRPNGKIVGLKTEEVIRDQDYMLMGVNYINPELDGTLAAFIGHYGIYRVASPASDNPNMLEKSVKMDHWFCTLIYGKNADRENEGKTMDLFFSQGTAYEGKRPHILDILNALADDSAGIENVQSFEEWADELGLDADSRKAEKTYNICIEQAQKLKDFLGEEAYNQLLRETERE